VSRESGAIQTVRAQVAAEAIVKQANALGVDLLGFLTRLPDCGRALGV